MDFKFLTAGALSLPTSSGDAALKAWLKEQRRLMHQDDDEFAGLIAAAMLDMPMPGNTGAPAKQKSIAKNATPAE